jgi:hypothetical protein
MWNIPSSGGFGTPLNPWAYSVLIYSFLEAVRAQAAAAHKNFCNSTLFQPNS